MPDWRQIAQEKLTASDLTPAQRDQVVRELASHLEECYEQALSAGHEEQAACAYALEEVPDWNALGADISRATQESHFMNHRTKTVWLPGIAILFAIGLVLVFLDRAAVLQRLIWLACMGMLLGAAHSEGSRLNLRTRSVWLPGFVSLAAASLSLFAVELIFTSVPSSYFTNAGSLPAHPFYGLAFRLYLGWLLVQVVCGAVAAFLSRRAQGSPRARLVAAAFPAIVMFALWMVVIPVSALAEHNAFVWNHPLYYLMGIFVWVVPPGIALLAGATPFLRDARPVAG